MLKAQRLPVPPLTLGEGPMWHSGRNALFFVDIEGRRLRGYREGTGLLLELETTDRIGFVVPHGAHLLAGVGTTMSMQDGSPRYSICRTTSACGSMMQNATRMDGCLLD